MLYAFAALVVLLILGWREERRSYQRLLERYNFAVEFMNRYTDLLAGLQVGSFDGETYQWLTMRVDRIQREMGGIGLVTYHAPFGRYIAHNYPVLLNTLPQIRTREAEPVMLNWAHDALTRYIGALQDPLDKKTGEMHNPVIWFRSGVQVVVTSPLLLAYWLGFIA